MQRRYLDPVSGQAAYYGIVAEGEQAGNRDRAPARLKTALITRGRMVYRARGRSGTARRRRHRAAWNPQGLTATPPPERVLPRSQRLPRETMIAIVNSYFDGITSHDGTVVRAHPGCNRYENGTRVTGRRGGINDDCVSGLTNFNLANVAGAPRGLCR